MIQWTSGYILRVSEGIPGVATNYRLKKRYFRSNVVSLSNAGEKSALIVWGGWDGHQPQQVAEIFERELRNRGFQVEVSDTLDAYKDVEKLKKLSLIVPVW